jgi:hypothetical protein
MPLDVLRAGSVARTGFVLLVGLGSGSAAVEASGQAPATPYEESGLTRHTSHAEMMAYLAAARTHASDMVLGRYGETIQGRELPYALFSRPRVTSPAEAHASGKPILLLAANVHGFNYLLRESLLVMVRELGTRGSALNDLLDEVIVIVVPSKNPDGLEADSRFNAAGADLNRDYMTLDQPETAAYVGNVINRWRPHLLVDGHDGGAVQYGGAYPYTLLYQGPAIAGADPTITALADREVFPHLSRSLEREGFRAFYWARGDRERWYGGGSAPRMGRNYGGLANTLSILFEHAEWHEPDDALRSGLLAYMSVVEWAAENPDVLTGAISEARRRTVELGERAEGRVPVAETAEAEEFRVSFEIPDPADPDRLLRVEDAELVKRPVGTLHRERPWAYVLPPEARDAVALLLRHGIQVERLTETVEREAVAYTLAGVQWEEGDNALRSALRVEVGATVEAPFELPRGSYVVPTGQLLGRVVAHLLEPETGDGVFYWNRMTALLPLAELDARRSVGPTGSPDDEPLLIPLRKLMRESGLPTVVIERP